LRPGLPCRRTTGFCGAQAEQLVLYGFSFPFVQRSGVFRSVALKSGYRRHFQCLLKHRSQGKGFPICMVLSCIEQRFLVSSSFTTFLVDLQCGVEFVLRSIRLSFAFR
jgi:hypothetical protein